MTTVTSPDDRATASSPAGGAQPLETPPQPPSRGALAELLRPIRGQLILATACQAVSALASIVPYIAVFELARVLVADGPTDTTRAWTAAGIGAGALVVRFVFLAAASGITHFADVELQLHIRRRMAEHLGRVPLGWFTARNAGQVKKSLQDDVQAMHHLVGHALTDLTGAVVAPIASLVYLLWIDWRMTLVTLLPLLIGMAAYARMMSGYSEKMVEYNRAMEQVNAAAVEFVQGIAVVKTFGQARRAHRRFIEVFNAFADYFLAWVSGMLTTTALVYIVLAPLVVVVVVLAGGVAFVGAAWIEPVDVLPFVLLGVGLTAPVLLLGYTTQELQTAQEAAGRVIALLDTPVLPEADQPARPDGHRVVFDGVRFAYDDDGDALVDVDLVLEPGTTTALVGPSGAGKTTMARLLPRFWDPDDGAITLGGVDLRAMATAELYRHVSFVFQDVQLLRTSVRDNIRLARPDADDATVERAARAAQIHDRIAELPRGYDTVIGEQVTLSGGEAQRVSIARALLADTPILVLDEATAFADPESEAVIQDAISELVAGRTLLVVAHRLSTIAGADQIVVVDGSRIVERGRHEELVAAGGRYARMWQAHERASRPGVTARDAQVTR